MANWRSSTALFSLCMYVVLTVEVYGVNARLHNRDFSNSVSMCPSGKYYNIKLGKCHKCSLCPVNEIIRRPCHKHRDTVCGPFTEFDRFNQAPAGAAREKNEEGKNENSISRSSNDVNGKINNKEDGTGRLKEGKQQNADVYEIHADHQGIPKRSEEKPGLASVTTDADEQWRLLALVLIAVLSVVSILLVIFVFIACYMLKKRRLMDKTVVCSSDVQPGGHYFRPPVFTADRINPTDHMRALLHVDSEMRNSPQRKENLFPVYSDEASSCLSNVQAYSDEAADPSEEALAADLAPSVGGDQSSGYNSNTDFPEVIPGPSTDYVYFKAPVKHSFGQV